LKTTNGGEPIGINPISVEVPNVFILEQNYPNPFNPISKIRYKISNTQIKNQIVKLIVYNSIGEEVAALVNEEQSPGTYEVTFDGSMIPSGVYFYRMNVGDFSETRKMVLIK
jgi:hypothetical protein